MQHLKRIKAYLRGLLDPYPVWQEALFPGKPAPRVPVERPELGQRIRVEIGKGKYASAIYIGRAWPLFAVCCMLDRPRRRIKRRLYTGMPKQIWIAERTTAFMNVSVVHPYLPGTCLHGELQRPESLDYLFRKLPGTCAICCEEDVWQLIRWWRTQPVCRACNAVQPLKELTAEQLALKEARCRVAVSSWPLGLPIPC